MSCRGCQVLVISSILFPCTDGLATGSFSASLDCAKINRGGAFGGSSADNVAVLSATGRTITAGRTQCGKHCVASIACQCFEYTISTKVCRLIKGSTCNNEITANVDVHSGKGCTLEGPDLQDYIQEYTWVWPSAFRVVAVLISLIGGACAWIASKSWSDFEVHPENFQKSYDEIDYFERRKLLDKPATALAMRFGYTERQAFTVGLIKAVLAHWFPSAATFFLCVFVGPTDVGSSYTQNIDLIARFYMVFHYFCYFWAVTYLVYDLLVIARIQQNERKLFLGLMFFTLPTKGTAYCTIMPKYKWSNLHTDTDEATFEIAWNTAGGYTVVNHLLSFLTEIFVAEKALIASLWWSLLEACHLSCFPMQLLVHLEPQIMMLLAMPCWISDSGPGMWTIYLTIQAVLGFTIQPQLMNERIRNTLVKDGP